MGNVISIAYKQTGWAGVCWFLWFPFSQPKQSHLEITLVFLPKRKKDWRKTFNYKLTTRVTEPYTNQGLTDARHIFTSQPSWHNSVIMVLHTSTSKLDVIKAGSISSLGECKRFEMYYFLITNRKICNPTTGAMSISYWGNKKGMRMLQCIVVESWFKLIF